MTGMLKKRLVYRGDVYNALESARINSLCRILIDRYKDGFHDGIKTAEEIIANEVDDAPSAQEWIPITTRPMTEDERKEWSEILGYDIEYDDAKIYCNLPDDGQRVLVYYKDSGEVGIDTYSDDDGGGYFEDNGDIDGITHWMPLPEPPKQEENGTD